eukprot:m.38451 g.38451  ORF g.38451 m.38451 type:complete len:298 (+) comp12588_c0_seq49:148-1041(+)
MTSSWILTALLLLCPTLHTRAAIAYKEPYPWVASRGGHHLWSTRDPKFYICLSPKVACSEWLKFIHQEMLPSELQPHGSALYRPHKFPDYNLERRDPQSQSDYHKVQAIAEDPSVYKFAVVRHPWDRINSAYRSKYEGACNYSKTCMIQQFQLTTLQKHVGPKVSFHDFVKAVSDMPVLELNSHFRPQTLLCELTTFPYDELVELKNLTQLDLAAKKSGFKSPFSQLSRPASTGKGYYGGRTSKYHDCTMETVRLAEVVYAIDAARLGYNFDDAYASCKEHGVSVWKPDMNVSELCI